MLQRPVLAFVLIAQAMILAVSGSLGKSTYAMSHPFAWKAFMENYFPTAENIVQANSTDTCVEWVKLCIDDGHMTSCRGPSGNVQLHSVGAYERESGEKTMPQLEALFTSGMGDMSKYDPFMDYHVGFYTADLDHYLAAFKAAGVPYFPSTFVDPVSKQEYSSVLIMTPGSLDEKANSLLNIMLVGNSSSLLDSSSVYRHTTARASSESLMAAQAKLSSAPRTTAIDSDKPVLQLLHVSFASSNLTRDVDFFQNVLQGKGTDTGSQIYSGKIIASDAAEVMFVESSTATQGEVTVAEWETYQSSLHKQCFDSAHNEGFDRLADNHIGHSLAGADLAPYVAAVKAYGLPYRFYGQGGMPFFYLYWPNGWGLQLIGTCSDCPAGGGYGFCTQGIKGHCETDSQTCDDKCTSQACGSTCAELTKTYDCATNYCPTCKWSGWCDKTCKFCGNSTSVFPLTPLVQ